MIALLLLQVALLGVRPVPDPLPMSGAHRTYIGVALDHVSTAHPYECAIGIVEMVRREDDEDDHVRLRDGAAILVVEIIKELRFPLPKIRQRVRACGLTRFDEAHRWNELHPLLVPFEVLRPLSDGVSGHPRSQTAVDAPGANIQKSRRLRNRVALSRDSQPHVLADVVHLRNLATNPPAIGRPVIPVVVAPIERIPVRARPHITQEAGEILTPVIAHGYPASAVILKVRGRANVATGLHTEPRVVLPRVPLPMCPTHGANDFTLMTTTAHGAAAPQVSSAGERNMTAVTSTSPDFVTRSTGRTVSARQTENSQPPEPLSCEVKPLSHNSHFTTVKSQSSSCFMRSGVVQDVGGWTLIGYDY